MQALCPQSDDATFARSVASPNNYFSEPTERYLGRIIKSDATIIQWGEKLCTKLGNDTSQHNYIRTKMREVARLIEVLRQE